MHHHKLLVEHHAGLNRVTAKQHVVMHPCPMVSLLLSPEQRYEVTSGKGIRTMAS